MIGMVLAAGAGKRLGDETADLPKTLLAVDGVLEAAVVGRPDPKLDEVAVAFVRVAPGRRPEPGLAERLVGECRRTLSDFKVPREVYLVEELPRSTMNKINKVALREVAPVDADRTQAERNWVAAAEPAEETP